MTTRTRTRSKLDEEIRELQLEQVRAKRVELRQKVSIAVFTELVGQMGRANRLQDALVITLAEDAVRYSELFVQAWEK